jgi:hypothetical protein
VLRQREDLECAAVKGEEIFVNETIPCQDELIDADSQECADLVIAVEGQSVSVGHEDQE